MGNIDNTKKTYKEKKFKDKKNNKYNLISQAKICENGLN